MHHEEAEYYYDDNVDSKRNYYSQAGRCPTPGLRVKSANECASAALSLKLVEKQVKPMPGRTYGCYWIHEMGGLSRVRIYSLISMCALAHKFCAFNLGIVSVVCYLVIARNVVLPRV